MAYIISMRKLKYHKIGMHNRSGSLKTGKQRHSDQTMVGSSLPPIVCKKAHVLQLVKQEPKKGCVRLL
jgi:hypothetical protein